MLCSLILGNLRASALWWAPSQSVHLYRCTCAWLASTGLELKDTVVLSKWGSPARPFLRRLSGSTFPNSRIKLTTVYSVNFTQGCPCPLSCCTTAILHVFLDAVVQMIFEGQAGHRGHPREAHVLSLSLLTRVARIASVANNLVCCMDENRKLQVLKHHGIALATLCQVQFAHKRGKNETSARASTALRRLTLVP